ncbi:MAG: hypothetical protein R3240_08690 [Gammaproteobacteria bacterium]|nr:hypothetical protein [Gammaproteobacteria bacterium]
MMSRVLFIGLAAFAFMAGKNLLLAPGTSISDPLIACAVALIISPWLLRQFE